MKVICAPAVGFVNPVGAVIRTSTTPVVVLLATKFKPALLVPLLNPTDPGEVVPMPGASVDTVTLTEKPPAICSIAPALPSGFR